MTIASINYRVPYADTDQMGVVYYANYFIFFERVRNEILRQINYSYLQMERDGFMLPVIESHCEYRMPAYYDDILEIRGWFDSGKGSRIKVKCEVMRTGELLATGYTVHACLSTTTSKPVRIPAAIAQRLEKNGGHTE